MRKHAMLDFETCSKGADSIVISLGVVLFTAEQKIGEREWHFDLEEQEKVYGRRHDPETMEWWAGQSEEARQCFERAKAEPTPLATFGPQFVEFIGLAHSKNVLVWGNGASFDIPIIEHILTQVGQPIPWNFWSQRCYRTIQQMFNVQKGIERHETKHRALGDAQYQARCLAGWLWENQQWDK